MAPQNSHADEEMSTRDHDGLTSTPPDMKVAPETGDDAANVQKAAGAVQRVNGRAGFGLTYWETVLAPKPTDAIVIQRAAHSTKPKEAHARPPLTPSKVSLVPETGPEAIDIQHAADATKPDKAHIGPPLTQPETDVVPEITDDTTTTQQAPSATPPAKRLKFNTGITNADILRLKPKLIKGVNILQLATTRTNHEIENDVNKHHSVGTLIPTRVTSRLAAAIKQFAKANWTTDKLVRAELQHQRVENGAAKRDAEFRSMRVRAGKVRRAHEEAAAYYGGGGGRNC